MSKSAVCGRTLLNFEHSMFPTCFHRNISSHICDKNSSGDEIVNLNFYAVRPKAIEFAEITQYNGHYAVHGHSRLPILLPIESSYATSY